MSKRILTVEVPDDECLHCIIARAIKAFYRCDEGNSKPVHAVIRALGENIGEIAACAPAGVAGTALIHEAATSAADRYYFIQTTDRPPQGHA